MLSQIDFDNKAVSDFVGIHGGGGCAQARTQDFSGGFPY